MQLNTDGLRCVIITENDTQRVQSKVNSWLALHKDKELVHIAFSRSNAVSMCLFYRDRMDLHDLVDRLTNGEE